MADFIRTHRTALLRVANVVGVLLCIDAIIVALTFDALFLTIVKSVVQNAHSVQSVHTISSTIEGVAGGLIVGLTAKAWKKKEVGHGSKTA